MVFKMSDKNNLIKLLNVSLLIALGAFSSQATATLLSVLPIKDNSIYNTINGNRSNALGALFAGTNGSNVEIRGLIKFDISSIPAGATINSVSLVIPVMIDSGFPDAREFTVHRLNVDWGEGSSKFGGTANGTTGGGAGGAAATPGDATWNESFYGVSGDGTGTDWTDGGDFVATASATVARGPGPTLSWDDSSVDFVNIALKQDVQDWVNGTTDNHGWLIQETSKTIMHLVKLGGKDTTGTVGSILAIDYTEAAVAVPIPSIVWLFSSVFLGLLGALKARQLK